MDDDEEWNALASQESTISFECDPRREVCTWFQIGQVQRLDYSNYDVAIELLNPEAYSNTNAVTVQFRILYVSEGYTYQQIVMRLTFCIFSLLVLLQYCTTLFGRIKIEDWK